MYLFVYGTLKKFNINHYIILFNKGIFCGNYRTLNKHQIINDANNIYVINNITDESKTIYIYGELYSIGNLNQIDHFEKCGNIYERILTEVINDDNHIIQAYMYVIKG